jgi:hypothetical protein
MRCLLAIAVAASIALGQEAGHAVISGTVVEASTGEPIRKAIVTLTLQGAPRRWATARTDSSGQFTFTGLPAGKYDLGATMQGVAAAWGSDLILLTQGGYVAPQAYGRFYGTTGGGKSPEVISIEEGEIRGGLKLLFIRSGSITGHVFEPDGHPAANVMVTVLSGKQAQVNLRRDITDDSGEYQFIGLDPGDYYLLATPQNQGARSQSGNGLLTPQYYGGSREWKDSTVLHVRGGENLTGTDFHLRAEQPHTIHGHLTGVPVLPPEHEEVLVRLGGQVYLAHAPDYSFDFSNLDFSNPLGGVYRVETRVEAGGQVWSASQPVDTRTAGDEVILPLAPPIDIKGQLRIEGQTERAKSDFEMRLVNNNSNDAPIAARPGADGDFNLKQATAGEWVLNVDKLPADAFLKSASLGDQDVRFKAFTIGPGSTGPLNIVISTRTAQLAGEVEAGSGDPRRAGIVLAPIGPFHDLDRFYTVAVSDDSGKFQFAHVAPGKYRIFALENMAPQPFRNPDAADQLGDLGTEIELTEGAELTVHPKLIPAQRAREALNREVRQ